MNVLDEATRARLLELYDEGKGIREIERETGVHRDTVSRYVGGLRSKHKLLSCIDRMWDWLDAKGLDATECDGLVDMQVLLYSCHRHPNAIAFEDVDDSGCRLCISEQLQAHHQRHKDAGVPIIPPRRKPKLPLPQLAPELAAMLAPPVNILRSMVPNKSQTIMNIVAALGPLDREKLYEHMADLLGLTFKRAKQLTQPLLWQLLHKRLAYDANENLVLAPPGAGHREVPDEETADEVIALAPVAPPPEPPSQPASAARIEAPAPKVDRLCAGCTHPDGQRRERGVKPPAPPPPKRAKTSAEKAVQESARTGWVIRNLPSQDPLVTETRARVHGGCVLAGEREHGRYLTPAGAKPPVCGRCGQPAPDGRIVVTATTNPLKEHFSTRVNVRMLGESDE